MKKKLILCAVYLTIAVIYVDAQNKKDLPSPPPPPPVEDLVAPPPPPAPPIPPPPPPVAVQRMAFTSQAIVNSNGYEISIQYVKGKTLVILNKNGVTQKIKLSTWNANRKYYEKKYGMLPPPPPAPPVVEEKFIEPAMKKDIQ